MGFGASSFNPDSFDDGTSPLTAGSLCLPFPFRRVLLSCMLFFLL